MVSFHTTKIRKHVHVGTLTLIFSDKIHAINKALIYWLSSLWFVPLSVFICLSLSFGNLLVLNAFHEFSNYFFEILVASLVFSIENLA